MAITFCNGTDYPAGLEEQLYLWSQKRIKENKEE